jgi:glycosyltransferase involved in cell wall biosynthesis
MPIYNVENHLQRSIDSLLSQNYQNIEILLIDQGSTDASGDIAEAYFLHQADKVRTFHIQHIGTFAAMNYGLKYIRGTYVSFVSPDSWVEPHFLENLYYTMKKNDVLMVSANYDEITNDDDMAFEKIYTAQEAFNLSQEKWQQVRFAVLGTIHNKLCHRSLFDHIQFPELHRYESFYPVYQLIMAAGKIGYLHKNLYHTHLAQNESIGDEDAHEKADALIRSSEEILAIMALASYGYQTQFESYVNNLHLAEQYYKEAGLNHKAQRCNQKYTLIEEVNDRNRHEF